MLSKKKCEKKLREISIIKRKEKKNADELEKIGQEKYYTEALNRFDNDRKLLDMLPDDVQQYIWGFVDTNTRLNFLRTIYTPEFINNRLSRLSFNRLTIKRLYSCIKYVKKTFTHYLNKDGEIYKDFIWYMGDSVYYPCTLKFFLKPPYTNDKLISIITAGIKNYTKMYKQTIDAKEIQANEMDILKLFARLSFIVHHFA